VAGYGDPRTTETTWGPTPFQKRCTVDGRKGAGKGDLGRWSGVRKGVSVIDGSPKVFRPGGEGTARWGWNRGITSGKTRCFQMTYRINGSEQGKNSFVET